MSPFPIPILILSLTLTLTLTLTPPSAATNPQTSLQSLCRRTAYSNLCIHSIHQTAPRLKTLNPKTALAILMQALNAKTREGKSFALHLAGNSRPDSRARELLLDCVDDYETALENLESAVGAVRAGDVGLRDAMLSSVISNLGSCDDGFVEFGLEDPLKDRTKVLQKMADNCLAIGGLSG